MASSSRNDGSTPTPFLLRLFYRTGAFHRPDEFAGSLPPHLVVYTTPDCTLQELALQMAAADSLLLPSPAAGTRLVFRLIYPDASAAPSSARFVVKDLGSVVMGSGGPGVDDAEDDDVDGAKTGGEDAAEKTLAEAKYVVGDFISCAILPPLAGGTVAPASLARTGRGAGVGEGRVSAIAPGARRDNDPEGKRRPWGRIGVGRGGTGPLAPVPKGEWRRGEKLPDGPSSRSRAGPFKRR